MLGTCLQLCAWCSVKTKPGNKIVIIEGPVQNQSGILTLNVYPFRHERFDPWIIKEIQQPIRNGYVKWEITGNSPVGLFNNTFSYSMAYLAEPGDSIVISHINNKIIFTGKGAQKFKLSKSIELFLDSIKHSPEGLSNGDKAAAASMQDYFAWNEYLNRKATEWLFILDKSKSSISSLAYLDLKDRLLRHIEKIRLHKFHSIRRSTVTGHINQYGLSNEDLCHIYDSTIDNAYSRWLRYERNYIFPVDYTWDILRDENYRRHNKFFNTNQADTSILGQDPADAYVAIYNMIKEKYKGIVRENLLAYTFYDSDGILSQVGFTPKTEMILKDYYSLTGYPEFKIKVKEYELERRKKWNQRNVPLFQLTDVAGNQFNNENSIGKIVVFDFWFTGCSGCIQMAPVLQSVENQFANDTNVIFASVSIDKDKYLWRKSVEKAKYTSGTGLQLYTGGEGANHPIIKQLMVESYPTLMLVDQDGYIIDFDHAKMDPRNDDGKALAQLLKKQQSISNDGPYLFYTKDSVQIHYLNEKHRIRSSIVLSQINKAGMTLDIMTDEYPKTFMVSLKSHLQEEPAEFDKPEKIMVLSDIEGNFTQLRKLLQLNNVIDENYNWTFGTGHLALAGDIFDRGKQVTECLWLIYSLEEKAKAAGGYVHFVLGNHEIMNLQGDFRYTDAKYKANSLSLRNFTSDLYSADSELGRWLRTKNIIEKIGDILLVHGGVSPNLNQLPLTLSEINRLAKPYYAAANSKHEYGDNNTNTIMNPKTSPFWYRNYYENKKEILQIIDNTLQKFGVNHIITGHTIVADTISTHFQDKIINTDTHHAAGKSEALLIENGQYYRVNAVGEKKQLFREAQNQLLLGIN